MKVLIVDDHPIVRRGVAEVLEERFPSVTLGRTGKIPEARRLLDEEQWNLVLLDISLRESKGLDFLKEIVASHPDTKVLVLSIYSVEHYGVRALKAGASGYLNKACEEEDLCRAVQHCLGGQRYITPELAEVLTKQVLGNEPGALHRGLSDREFLVMCLLAEGKTVGSIAIELNLSPKTVSTYRTRLMKKMGFDTDVKLIRYALENRLV